jgi:integrase
VGSTPAQIVTVLATLRGKPSHPIVALMLATGLRRSEALALRWQDVNLDGGTLQVEQALEQTKPRGEGQTKRGGLVFRQPKTKHGRRTVTLPPSTVAILRDHRKAKLEQRLFLGLGKARDDALVFTSVDGSPYLPSTLTLQWRRAMRRAGFKATLHSLRHTHASTLIAAGLDVLTISRRLGHGKPAITLNVYGHLIKPDDRAAAVIEKALAATEEG